MSMGDPYPFVYCGCVGCVRPFYGYNQPSPYVSAECLEVPNRISLSDLRTILARRVSEAGGPEAWGAQLGVQPHHVTAVLDHGAAPAPLLVAGLGLVEVRMYAVQGVGE